ncbi:MAG: hypothetical protein PHZ16_05495 [Eubacteriales bacterium]|nr:hypothetical protein [Eubacteriales bacterium]
MKDKIKAPIEQIELNVATYCGTSFMPTLINFFYGKNGTGKSTIARVIADGVGIKWGVGESPENYDVLHQYDGNRTGHTLRRKTLFISTHKRPPACRWSLQSLTGKAYITLL